MNRKVGIALCAIALTLLTACGGKKSSNVLTCTNVQFNGAYISDVVIQYNYDGTQIIGTNLKATIDFNGRTLEELGCTTSTLEECASNLVKQMESSCTVGALIENCKISDKTSLGFVFTANVKKESLSTYFSGISLETSKSELKQQLEQRSSTVTCK